MSINEKDKYLSYNYIGDKIHYLRKGKGLTLMQVSRLIDGSAGFLSDIEKGKSLPSIPRLIELCNIFNVTLSDFFNDASDATLPSDVQELLEAVKGLDEKQIKKLTEFITLIK